MNLQYKKKSIMWKYIKEEQAVLFPLLESTQVQQITSSLPVHSYSQIFFIAHGSSYNASCVISIMMEEYAHIKVHCFTPLTFRSYQYNLTELDKDKILIIGISQTGTSRGVIESLQYAKHLGYTVLSISDTLQTPVHTLGDYYLNIMCGSELSNAKTKGYSNTLLLLQLFTIELGLKRNVLSLDVYQSVKEEIRHSINLLPITIDKAIHWIDTHDFGHHMSSICFLGYGNNLGNVMEGMLKLLETMCIPTMFNDIEEFSHGMHRTIQKDSRIVLILQDGPGYEQMVSTYYYLKNITRYCIMVNASSTIFDDDFIINLPKLSTTKAVLHVVSIIQVFSVAIPEMNDKDPNAYANDDFTNLLSVRI